MEYSRTGEQLTEQFESCRLVAYLDSGGIPTIGYGHTTNVQLGDTCTQAQADAWLMQDIQTAVDAVNRMVTVSLTQNEFDALCDWVYNCGGGNFAGSTLLRLLNQGDYAGAANEFERWDRSGGVVVAGLLRRRTAEKEEWNGLNPQ